MGMKRISPEVICETASFNDTANHSLCTYAVPIGCVVYMEAVVIGKDASNNVIAAKNAIAASQSSGTVTLVGSIINLLSFIDLSNLGAAVSIVVSGGNVSVQVKGPTVAKNIEWQAELKVYIN